MAVYLLRYHDYAGDPSRPYASARYYLGWCLDSRLVRRIEEHWNGTWIEQTIPTRKPPALSKWFFDHGIKFTLVRVWWGADRTYERKLKRAGHYCRHDPFNDQTLHTYVSTSTRYNRAA